ncbi:MAG: hypothetical protein AAF193_06045, partial [Bacteroidota bacterium]
MKQFILLLGIFCVAGAFAQSNLEYAKADGTIRYPQPTFTVLQQEMAKIPAWQNFKDNHPRWNANFNAQHRLPHRAWGPGIAVSGVGAEAKAQNAISNVLADFGVRGDQLSEAVLSDGKNHTRVFYKQVIDGL